MYKRCPYCQQRHWRSECPHCAKMRQEDESFRAARLVAARRKRDDDSFDTTSFAMGTLMAGQPYGTAAATTSETFTPGGGTFSGAGASVSWSSESTSTSSSSDSSSSSSSSGGDSGGGGGGGSD